MTEPVRQRSDNQEEHRAELANRINLILQGRLNVLTTVVLADATTSTVLTDQRIWASTVPVLVPLSAVAAAVLPSVYVSARAAGTLTLTHNNPGAAASFAVLLIG